MKRPLFVSFIGWSETGKTTLIVRCIEECRRRGIPVAAAKRARHEADLAPEGKDSSRFLAAGALASLYVGDRAAVRFEPTPALQDRAYYAAALPGAAIVLLEGSLVEGAICVQVAGSAVLESTLKKRISDCDILISDDPGLANLARDAGVRSLAPGQVEEFVDMMEAYNET